jgi:hypothetical protein
MRSFLEETKFHHMYRLPRDGPPILPRPAEQRLIARPGDDTQRKASGKKSAPAIIKLIAPGVMPRTDTV